MKNDFIKIYTAIDKKEQVTFHNYIQCFYGGQKYAISIFEEIVEATSKTSPLQISEGLKKVRQKTIDQKNRLNAFDDLKKWLLEFLALQELRENTIEAKIFKLDALRKRNLSEAFLQNSKKLVVELEKNQNPDQWLFLWKMRLSHLNYFSVTRDRLKEDMQPELEKLMQALDDFYISSKLLYGSEFFNRSKILQDKYQITLLSEIEEMLEREHFVNETIYKVYKPLLELVKQGTHSAYLKLKQFIVENPQHNYLERQSILLHLINYTARHFDQENHFFHHENFELYEVGIEQGFFTNSGYFSVNSFLNIVNIACFLKRHEWAKYFVKEYDSFLPPQEKVEVSTIASAKIAFDEVDFDKVLLLLINMKFKNVNLELNVYLLTLRAWYETRNSNNYTLEFLISKAESLYFYASRNKRLGDALRQKVLNFYKIYRALITRHSKIKLLKELKNTQTAIFCYDWLKLKIESLPD
jgi:hypothetical protein